MPAQFSFQSLAGGLLAACLLSALLPSSSAAERPEPLKVLMVTGGCCHDYEQQKRILSEGISSRANVAFTIVHEGSDRDVRVSIYEQANWADGYDVVLHNECYGAIDDDAFINRTAQPHLDGLPAVMLHCSTHSYRAGKTDAWRQVLGMTSVRHEKRRDLLVRNLAADHPVMHGFPKEWLNRDDELYVNVKVWDTATPLANAYGLDTKQDHVVVWLNTAGSGRVFATTLGHQNTTMEDPIYLDLVARGLLWSCGKLGDDGQPVAGYGPGR